MAAYERIVANVKERAPSARVIGVSVEEMCYGGTEVIVGLNQDPQFGPVIMFGLGGIFTEVLPGHRLPRRAHLRMRRPFHDPRDQRSPDSGRISPPAPGLGGHVGRTC